MDYGNYSKKKTSGGFWFALFFLMISMAMAGFFYLKGREIIDFFAAQNFTPSAKIQQIVDKIKPTERAKTIFYATNPQIQTAEDFNKNCTNKREETFVLGCYKADRIFVFDVENADLTGAEEVTAAHELLHAVWDRMTESERKSLSEKLLAEYEKIKTPEFEALMKEYAITQPGEHENELHSLIGTEFVELSADLETHYATIFQDRKAIAQIYQGYKSKFENLKKRASELNDEILNLKKNIEIEQSDYNSKLKYLETDIQDFNAKVQNGEISADYDYVRRYLENRIEYLNEYRDAINAKVADFNTKKDELIKISNQIQTLYDGLNSNVQKSEKESTNL